ncbi:hypothetical protein [Streptomyces sp. NPDC006552]|uniref:hypothetical protein n=1 Tax=Streptomyces sp. NPDC006552 TaxID=3157179 RepID=UPI0033A025C4
MSFGLTLYRFSGGELAGLSADAIRDFLARHSDLRTGVSTGPEEFRIRAHDGSEAELSLCDGVLAVERPQAGAVWDVLIGLVTHIGAGILLPDGAFLCPEGMRGELPDGMADDAAVCVPEITLDAVERIAGPFVKPLGQR